MRQFQNKNENLGQMPWEVRLSSRKGRKRGIFLPQNESSLVFPLSPSLLFVSGDLGREGGKTSEISGWAFPATGVDFRTFGCQKLTWNVHFPVVYSPFRSRVGHNRNGKWVRRRNWNLTVKGQFRGKALQCFLSFELKDRCKIGIQSELLFLPTFPFQSRFSLVVPGGS